MQLRASYVYACILDYFMCAREEFDASLGILCRGIVIIDILG